MVEDKMQVVIYEGFPLIPDSVVIVETDGKYQASFVFNHHRTRLIVGFKKNTTMVDYLCTEMKQGFGNWDLAEFYRLGMIEFVKELPID